MPTDLDQLGLLTLLVWLSVLLLFFFFLSALFFSVRSLRFNLGVAWSNHTTAGSSLRAWLLTAAVAIVAALLVQISTGETLAVRLAMLAVGVAVTYVLIDWAWKQVIASALRRSGEARDWQLRSSSAAAELLKLFEPDAIHRTACSLLQSNLGCSHAWLFLATGNSHSLAASAPTPPSSDVSFSTTSLLHQELSSGMNLNALPVFDPVMMLPLRWSQGHPDRLAAEQSLLRSLNAQVVVPLRRELNLTGFFVLGPLAGDQPYAPHHLRFAEAIAHQTSLSLITAEHSVAAFRIATEAAEEQASRRSARATRCHLAPPDRFELPGLDFSVQYWSGDLPGTTFYDVVSLPQRTVMFFLAEIPGPAEEASVRLVQLQALLRTRARAYQEDLAELLESTRRALSLTAANRPPISLFCARFNSGSSKLHFVNAGHYPPLLMRLQPDGAQIARLTTGDPALCVGSSCSFHEGEVEILNGDVISIASSSIPAATNPEAQPWGETNFVDSLLGWESQRPHELAQLTLASALEYTGHDLNQPPRFLIILRPVAL